jgi:hypothetical protein
MRLRHALYTQTSAGLQHGALPANLPLKVDARLQPSLLMPGTGGRLL